MIKVQTLRSIIYLDNSLHKFDHVSNKSNSLITDNSMDDNQYHFWELSNRLNLK